MTARPQAHDRAWHERRSKSLGASDTPVILGLSPYANADPWRIAMEKRGLVRAHVERSSGAPDYIEAAGRMWLADQIGAQVDFDDARDFCRGPGAPHLHATLDGRVLYHGEPATYQHKDVGWDNPELDAWRTGIPGDVRVQCQQEMLCSGLAVALVVVFMPRKRWELRIELARKDFQQWLIEHTRAWWQRHVIDGADPEMTPGDDAVCIMRELWPPKKTLPPIELDAEQTAKVRHWASLGAQARSLTAERKTVEAELRGFLRDAPSARLADGGLLVRQGRDVLAIKE